MQTHRRRSSAATRCDRLPPLYPIAFRIVRNQNKTEGSPCCIISNRLKIFFSHYARLLCDTVIPFQEDVLNDRIAGVAPSHAIENFERAAALLEGDESMRGTFYGMSFQDSDVGKWIEAAAYSLLIKPDPALEKRLDALCDVIARAQEPDGYLNTYFTLTCPDRKFANLLEGCELYCAGHLMEGAAALYEATGNRKLLDVMCKNADLFYRHFITQGAEGYPGHPEVELGLIRLWQATGEPRYRQLADAGHLQYTKAAAKPSLLLRQLFLWRGSRFPADFSCFSAGLPV